MKGLGTYLRKVVIGGHQADDGGLSERKKADTYSQNYCSSTAPLICHMICITSQNVSLAALSPQPCHLVLTYTFTITLTPPHPHPTTSCLCLALVCKHKCKCGMCSHLHLHASTVLPFAPFRPTCLPSHHPRPCVQNTNGNTLACTHTPVILAITLISSSLHLTTLTLAIHHPCHLITPLLPITVTL